MNVDRPSIVFDCSKVSQMDGSAITLLLSCLEEAMKRNGDVKLAGISAEAKAMLELSAADRLFEIYDTAAEAASSFRRRSTSSVADALASGNSLRTAATSA
jgi:anti-anti-sigma factor